MKTRIIGLVAGTALSLLLTVEARAGFTFSTQIVPISQAIGLASTIGFQGISGPGGPTLIGDENISLAEVIDTTTQAPGTTDMGSVPYSISIAIDQGGTDPAGTGNLTVAGTLTFDRSDTGGDLSFNMVTSGTATTTIAGVTYTIQQNAIVYTPPTVEAGFGTSGTGGISALIDVTSASNAAPLPSAASGGLVLLGVIFVIKNTRLLRQ